MAVSAGEQSGLTHIPQVKAARGPEKGLTKAWDSNCLHLQHFSLFKKEKNKVSPIDETHWCLQVPMSITIEPYRTFL